MKKFKDGRAGAKGYNIIRPFFKRAYKNVGQLFISSPYMKFNDPNLHSS